MPRQPELQGPEAFLSAIRDTGANLRDQYVDDPEGLANRLGLRLPRKPLQVMQELGVYDPEVHGPIKPGLRELVLDVCTGEEESAVAVGPRGGGKSQGVSFIEFFLWLLKNYDALNLGGSELQANNVYTYLLSYLDSDPYWKTLLLGDPKISESINREKAWIRVMAASSKSVRSPHAGGIRNVNGRMVERGGLLVIDEEAEADPGIVTSALPTVNTARPSVNVRCSTFHNAEGTFAEVVDNHEQMGYKMYSWDIFDVAERCDCTGVCQSEEPCFAKDHVEYTTDPDTGEEKEVLVHKAYCGGRSMYAEGWIPQGEILKMWQRMRRSHSLWEVEAMGSRPSTAGFVIKDLKKFNDNITSISATELYQPSSPITICVDWGATAAGVTVWQEQYRETVRHTLLHADLVEEAGLLQIIGVVLGYWNRYPEAMEVAADIGGGGNYLNPHLVNDHRVPCRDVNFQMEKEAGVAAWNVFNELGQCDYPAEYEEFIRQARRWKRKSGHIQKGDDHLMDSSVCYFAKFIDRLGLSGIRIAPKSFSTYAASTAVDALPNQDIPGAHQRGHAPRISPVVRPVSVRIR